MLSNLVHGLQGVVPAVHAGSSISALQILCCQCPKAAVQKVSNTSTEHLMTNAGAFSTSAAEEYETWILQVKVKSCGVHLCYECKLNSLSATPIDTTAESECAARSTQAMEAHGSHTICHGPPLLHITWQGLAESKHDWRAWTHPCVIFPLYSQAAQLPHSCMYMCSML